MNDPDVIAYLFAADGVEDSFATDVIYWAQNQRLFVAPRKRRQKKLTAAPQKESLDRRARGATKQPEEKKKEKKG